MNFHSVYLSTDKLDASAQHSSNRKSKSETQMVSKNVSNHRGGKPFLLFKASV